MFHTVLGCLTFLYSVTRIFGIFNDFWGVVFYLSLRRQVKECDGALFWEPTVVDRGKKEGEWIGLWTGRWEIEYFVVMWQCRMNIRMIGLITPNDSTQCRKISLSVRFFLATKRGVSENNHSWDGLHDSNCRWINLSHGWNCPAVVAHAYVPFTHTLPKTCPVGKMATFFFALLLLYETHGWLNKYDVVSLCSRNQHVGELLTWSPIIILIGDR